MKSVWNELIAFTHLYGILPVIGKEFGFEELPQAHAYLESRLSVGKVIVNMGDPINEQ